MSSSNRDIDEAAKLLCSQRILRLKNDPLRLSYIKPIHFETIGRYCELTRQTKEQITKSGSPDGVTIKHGDAPPLVLYNENVSLRRRAFTLAHEVGHIYLNHRDDSPQNEHSANTFAANLLAPRILLRELGRGRDIDACISQICDIFLISHTAVQVQLSCLPDSQKAFSDIELQLLKIYKPLLPRRGEPYLGF